MRIPETGTVVAQAERAEQPAGTASRSPTRRTSSATRSSRSRSPRPRPSGCASRPASPTRTRAIRPRSPTSRRRCRRRRAVGSCSASAGATPRCSTSGCKPMKVDDFIASRSPTCRRTSRTARSTATAIRAGCSGSTGAANRRCRSTSRRRARAIIEFAATIAERVTLAVGADPDRVAWALDLARGRGRQRARPRRDLVRRVRQRRVPSRPRRGARR